MEEHEIHRVLWRDYDDDMEFPNQKPLLAHYTSIANFDCIIQGEELWFSNPLNMNDLEELIHGMSFGANEFRHSSALLNACGDGKIFKRLLEIFDHYYSQFDEHHALDTYVLCFSEHDSGDYDGSLSMWRGYGSNGGGVAFVIDTGSIIPNENSPIILSKVKYLAAEERLGWIKSKIEDMANVLASLQKSDEVLSQVAWHWIERLKVFSLFTKHLGFADEREWRFVYLNDRDHDRKYESMFGYHVTKNGVENKLKLKIRDVSDGALNLTVENLIDRIILGPSVSSELSKRSMARLLKVQGKEGLLGRIYASSIPYRQ